MSDHEAWLSLTPKMLECLARFADGRARRNEHAAGTISSLRKAGLLEMIPRGTHLPEDAEQRGLFASQPMRRYRITPAGVVALGRGR